MMAIADMGEELSAARDVLKNLQPPSPPMVSLVLVFLICNMSQRVDTCVLFTYSVQLAMYFNSR